MPSTEVLDFGALIAPIAGDNPAGTDLRGDPSPRSPYYTVKDARSAARAAERQIAMEGEEPASPPDWRSVQENALKTIAEKSKDLEITAYLIESLVRLQGFPGLRDGFRLARELVEQFWDGLYPLPDEDGLETRVAPLTGLNGDDGEGTLINPIQKVALTDGRIGEPYAYYHYQQVEAVSKIADEEARQKRIQQGSLAPEEFEKAVARTPTAFFINLVEDLTQTQEEFARLGSVLEEKCGDKAPPLSNIRAALSQCLETVEYVARDRLAQARQLAETLPEEDNATVSDGQPAAATKTDGQLRSRDDALALVLKVADYFRRTEPHSPVTFALEQAVRWGRMPLPVLLAELIPDEASRMHFFKMIGIRPEQVEQTG